MRIRIEKATRTAEWVMADDSDTVSIIEAVKIALRAVWPGPEDPVLEALFEGGPEAADKALAELKH